MTTVGSQYELVKNSPGELFITINPYEKRLYAIFYKEQEDQLYESSYSAKSSVATFSWREVEVGGNVYSRAWNDDWMLLEKFKGSIVDFELEYGEPF